MNDKLEHVVEGAQTAWLMWWNRYLVGVYADEVACREDLEDAQKAVATIHGARAGALHVSRTRIMVASHRVTHARLGLLRDRAVADLIEEFGLIAGADREPRAGEIEPLLVELGVHRGYPGFQFDSDGLLLPGLSVALATLRKAGWDDLSIAMWFGSPQGSANGRVPAAVLPHDPMLVVSAAHSTAAG